MKYIKLILLLSLFMLIGCGVNSDDSGYTNSQTVSYDLWRYLTPQKSYEIEYERYENGLKTDYFFEVNRIVSLDVVERDAEGKITTLTRQENSIRIVESSGETIDVQRFVKLGDQDIFHGSSTLYCSVVDFYHSIVLRSIEFFNVIQINCKTSSSSSQFYYGYEEGIVFVSRDDGIVKNEIVKVGERRVD